MYTIFPRKNKAPLGGGGVFVAFYIKPSVCKADSTVKIFCKGLIVIYQLTTSKHTLNTHVSDLIHASDIVSFPPNSAIFLNVGTGGGKSYFCKHTLYNVAAEQNKRVLYIISRANPRDQFYNEIVKAGKQDYISITTYQALESRILAGEPYILYKYDYIVFDEYHRFVSDSIIDSNTDLLLEEVFNCSAVRFFLSATPYGMDRYLQQRFSQKNIYYTSYYLPAYYTSMTLHVYQNQISIEHVLSKAINENVKAVCFSTNIQLLRDLYQKYQECSLFICSESNSEYAKYVDEDNKQTMLESETLPCIILFATTCLDIGFNLNDTSIKYIICDLDDIDQIKQCIGRRRIKHENDALQVYVKNQSTSMMQRSIKDWEKRIEPVIYLNRYGVVAYKQRYLQRHQYKPSRLIFWGSDERGNPLLQASELTYRYYAHRIKRCREVLDSGNNFLNFLKGEFDCNTIDREIALHSNIVRYVYLLSVVGKEFDLQERKEFCRQLNYRDTYRNLVKTIDKINKELQAECLPFEVQKIIVKKRTFWMVTLIE